MSPQLLRVATPVARKPHRCSTCTGPIHRGDPYDRATLIHDGRIYDWLTCPTCLDDHIPTRVYEWAGFDPDEGFGSEDAHEWAAENAGLPEADAFLDRSRRRRRPLGLIENTPKGN